MYAPRKVKLIFTKHAIQRIYERGYELREIIQFFERNKLAFMDKNKQGYEIQIPMKGKLVGDFEGEGSFIVKSFLYPIMPTTNYSKYFPVVINSIHLPINHTATARILRRKVYGKLS